MLKSLRYLTGDAFKHAAFQRWLLIIMTMVMYNDVITMSSCFSWFLYGSVGGLGGSHRDDAVY